ncbi:hypothetical protein JB92DRAFT_2886520 [Gautieria morchelliformis]|nr:hypothetical protein JB92DRAFT_2886520 [Gautieria morchelliformis]
MDYSALEPFVPSISIFSLPDAVFELRLHLHLPHAGSAAASSPADDLAVADVELTPNGEYLVVTGIVRPSAAMGTGAGAEPYPYACAKTGLAEFHQAAHGPLVWTDQPCGRFGRDVRLGLSPGTEYVVLDRRVEYGDYVVRYSLRNKLEYPYQSNQACHTLDDAGVAYHHFGGTSVNGYHTAARFDYHNHVPSAPHKFPPTHPHFHPHLSATSPTGPFPPTAFPNTILTDAPQGDTTVLPGSDVGVAGVTSTSGTLHGVNIHLDQHTAHISNGYGYQYAQGLGVGHTAQTGRVHLGLNQSGVSASAGASGAAQVRFADSEDAGGVSLSASSGQHAGYSHSRGEVVGVTVLPGSGVGAVRESVTVEGVRSTEEIRQSSTSQTTEKSAELDVTTSTNGITGAAGGAYVRFADSEDAAGVSLSASSGQHAGYSQSRGEAVGVTVLPGSGVGAARESVTVEGVRSTEEIMQSSTLQTTENSAELDVTTSTNGRMGISGGAYVRIADSEGAAGVSLSASLGQHAKHSHSRGEAVGVTVLPGSGVGAVRECVTVGGVRSTEEIMQSSTSRTTEKSAELDVSTSTNSITGASGGAHVRLANSDAAGVSLSASSGQHAGYSQSRGEAVGVTVLPGSGVGAVREFVTVEGVRSTEEIMQSSTSRTTEKSAELDVTMSNNGRMGVSGGAYVRLADSEGAGASASSGQHAGHSHSREEAVAVTVLPGSGVGAAREFITVGGVRSTEEMSSSTSQTTEKSAELDVTTSTNGITGASGGARVRLADSEDVGGVWLSASSGQHAGHSQSRGEAVGVTVLPVSGVGAVWLTEEMSSSAESSAELDVTMSTNGITFVESSGQDGIVDITVLSGKGKARESVTGGIVRESTQANQSSMQASAGLDLTASANQSRGEAVGVTVLPVGGVGAVRFTEEMSSSAESSAELDVTMSTNGITFVESSGQDGIVDITVLSGNGKARESVTGGIVRESTQANQSSMQASAELDVTASTKHVTFAESSGQHGIQAAGNVAEVALLPGREIVRESAASELVRQSTEEIQSSTRLIAQRSAEVDVATSTNRATITESSRQVAGQVAGETVDVTILTGRENAKQFVTGGFGWQSTEGNIQSSTQQSRSTQSSSELDVATSTNRVTLAETSSGQYGGQVAGEVVGVTVLAGGKHVRESQTGEIVRESTQEIAESSTLQSTQASAELGITTSSHSERVAESSGQYGGQVAEAVLDVKIAPGRRDMRGVVFGEISREAVTGEIEREYGTGQSVQGSTQEIQTSTTQTTQASAAREVVGVTVLPGRGNIREFNTGEVALQSMQGITGSSILQTTTRASAEVDVATSANRVTFAESSSQYGEQGAREVVGVTVLPGRGDIRESNIGEMVLQSTQGITESSTLQTTTQASAEVDVATSTNRVTFAESSSQYGEQGAREVVGVTVLPGRGNIRESVIGETMQQSTQGITESSTLQTTTQASAEVDVATSTNRVTFAESSGQYEEQGAREVVGVTVLPGRRNIRESNIGEMVLQSRQGITESSTLQTTTQASAEVDVATSANRGTFAQPSSQYGAEVSEGEVLDVTVLTGTENIRESVKGEIVREATEEITQSSSLETTQMSSELDISQQTIQSGGLITNTALSVGGGAVDYIRGSGRDGNGVRVSVVEQERRTATAPTFEYGSSSREIEQSTTQETSTAGETTAVIVTEAEQFVEQPWGTVVSLVGERASGSRMQGFTEGTTIEAATLETTNIDAELSSADASGVAFQTGTRVGVVTADGRTVTGENVDSRITYQSGGQAASTEIRRTEINNGFAETEGVERDFSLGRSQTDSSTEHVSHVSDHASRSSSSVHSDNWHDVGRASSMTLAPTLGTTEQIQTTFERLWVVDPMNPIG